MYFGIKKRLKSEGLNDEQIEVWLTNKGVFELVPLEVGNYLGDYPSESVGIKEFQIAIAYALNKENAAKEKEKAVKRFGELRKIAENRLKDPSIDFSKYSEKRTPRRRLIRSIKEDTSPSPIPTYKKYSTSFYKEIYFYITNLLKESVNDDFQWLSDEWYKRIEIYIDELKFKEVAKEFFVEKFKEYVKKEFLDRSVTKNVDRLPERKPYFSQLKEAQNIWFNKIGKYPELIEAYLEGDEEPIKKENWLITDLLEFEAAYNFLIAFNEEYHFEDTNKDIIDEKYYKILSEFPKVFASVEVVIFTFNKIESFVKFVPANISSLYFALFKRNLVSKNKTEFQGYVSKVHNLEFGKIREDKTKGLTPHKTRINQFLEEIDAHFPPKNQ